MPSSSESDGPVLFDYLALDNRWHVPPEGLTILQSTRRNVSDFANLQQNCCDKFNPYPTAFPYGNGTVLHFYQQQESSTTKTVHKVINKGLKAYV